MQFNLHLCARLFSYSVTPLLVISLILATLGLSDHLTYNLSM